MVPALCFPDDPFEQAEVEQRLAALELDLQCPRETES